MRPPSAFDQGSSQFEALKLTHGSELRYTGVRDCGLAEIEILETGKILDSGRGTLGLPDRLRQTRCFFPFIIFFYCLFVKGGIRDGWAGIYYAFQRMLAEILLALYLIEKELGSREAGKPDSRQESRAVDLKSET